MSVCGTPLLILFLIAVFVWLLAPTLIKYFWNRCRLNYYASKLVGPPAFPLIGSAFYFYGGTQKIFETAMRIAEKYKPLFKFWCGTKFVVIITDPEDVKIILNSCLEKDNYYEFAIPALGYGLITLPAREWSRHRKIVGLAFNKQILNSFVETFASYSHILVQKLEGTLGKGCVDVYPTLSQCTLDMICDTTMGTNVNAMKEKSQYEVWFSRLAELSSLRLCNIFLHPNFIWKFTSLSKEMNSVTENVNRYVESIIESKKRAKYQMKDFYDGIAKKKVLLDHLIDLTYKEGNWSDKELKEEIKTIITAGSETTASTVGYVLTILGMRQDIQDLVLEEIDSITGSSGKDIAVEDLSKMTYLDRVIKETLRLFPIVGMIGRYLDNNINLKNCILPRGSSVGIPIIFIHRLPEFWANPLMFDPDRFLPEEVAKRHPYTFLPFSGGPRNCLGYRYAMLAMKTILSTVLKRYRVVSTEYKSISEIQFKFNMVLKCVGGHKVELEKRF